MDLGFKIHGFPKNHQVYPGSPWRIHWKGVISVVREAVLSVRRDARDGLGGLAMARGHSMPQLS